MKLKLKTHLISGAGNTFHILFVSDLGIASENLTTDQMKKITQLVCSTNTADGVIFLNKESTHYKWHFYNNDGSDAEMCGNASRCVGFYIKNILAAEGSQWQLETIAGKIGIESLSSMSFRITMTPISKSASTKGFFCDTGVPHLVLETKKLNLSEDLKNQARQLRFDKEFAPRGTNVTYVELLEDPTKIKAASYERGVEDFTQACGTGAMAAAYFNLTKRGVSQSQVEMPGGTLMMNLSNLKSPLMTGPAKLLGNYDYEVEI